MTSPENKILLDISLEKLFKDMQLGPLNLREAKLKDFCNLLSCSISEIQGQTDSELYSINYGSRCGIFFDKKTQKVFEMDIHIHFKDGLFGDIFPEIPLFLDCAWKEAASLLTYNYMEKYLERNQLFHTKYFLPYSKKYKTESDEIHIVWHNQQMAVWFTKPLKYHEFVISRIKYISTYSLQITDLHNVYLNQFHSNTMD